MKYKMTKDNNYTFDSLFDFPFFRVNRLSQTMRSDIIEYEDHYKILVDVPGIVKEDIKLITNDGYLEVYVSKKEEENIKYLHHERFNGEWERKFYIGNADKSNVDAKLNNGVLELTVYKNKNENNEKYIEIK